jgi:hypothetical protein
VSSSTKKKTTRNYAPAVAECGAFSLLSKAQTEARSHVLTVLSEDEITHLHGFFSAVANGMLRARVPRGHLFIASNPLLSTTTFHALQSAGLRSAGR